MIVQDLSMGFDCSQAYPADNGKIETVKDLATTLCKLYDVFKCSDSYLLKNLPK